MKSKSLIIALAGSLGLLACNTLKKEGTEPGSISPASPETLSQTPDVFYQYSIWFAFVNKIFDGDLKVSKLKSKGDIGLGSFDFLEGELVMLDGVAYMIPESGEVRIGEDHEEIVYADATFFDEDGSFSMEGPTDFESFKAALDGEMKSPHYFYAYKVHGNFDYVKLGGVPQVERPFSDGLDVLLPRRPVFETENISGTLVGFYCPDFIGDINARGHHFHFISDDRKWGGHMMEFKNSDGFTVPFDEIHSYAFDLPASTDFEQVKLDKVFQYNK